MLGFTDWLYARYRSNYLTAVIVVTLGAVVIVVAVPGTIGSTLWITLTPSERAAFTFVTTVLVGIGCAAAAATLYRGPLGLIRSWLDGDEGDPERVWNALHLMPGQATVRAVAVIAVLQAAAAVPRATRWSGSSGGWGAVAISAAGLALILAGAAFAIIGMHLLLRPLAAEISMQLPSGVALRKRGLGVRPRLLLGTAACGVMAGIFTAGAAVQLDTRVSQLGLAVVVAFLISGYLVIVTDVGFARSVLSPLDDLTEATRRVARGSYDQPAPVTTADEIGEVISAFNEMQLGLAERERLHSAFGSYVDPALAERLLEQSGELFTGESVEVTVLFADVRGFTTFAEAHDPHAAVARLNQLFEIVVPLLRHHHGHANKFLGDGVMAVFGVPERIATHADEAVQAAEEIQLAVRDQLGDDLRIGIGVNTGPVIAGTIGGGGKLEFTLIGDAVNVAARVEQLTKQTGDAVLLAQPTVDALAVQPSGLLSRGLHDLRGRSAPVEVHALDPFAGQDDRRPVG